MTLEEKVKKYFELSQQMKALKDEADALKDEIVAQMEAADLKKVNIDNLTASITPKEYVKYTDELAILGFLKNQGYMNFVKESVDTTNFNKALKTNNSLQENLKGYYTTTISSSLSVKEAKE